MIKSRVQEIVRKVNRLKTLLPVRNTLVLPTPGPLDYSYFDPTPEDLAGFREGEVFLTSFPRSGNTWMRNLLSSALARPMDEAIPDIHDPGFSLSASLSLSPGPVMFKSHNVSHLLSRRHVYLFRQPADALVSYAYLAERGTPNCDAFVCERLLSWIWHVETARVHALSSPTNWLLISYERLLRDTEQCVRETLRFLGFHESDFDVSRAMLVKKINPCSKTGAMYRSGKVGKGRTRISPRVWDLVQTHANGSYEAILRVEKDAVLKRLGSR